MKGLWGAWTWEPLVLLGMGTAACWYAAGARRLWRRAGAGRALGRGHAWLFASGLLAVGLALLSPLDTLSDALFSAHMTQHLILILIAAPLLVLGRPLLPLVWALPQSWRRRAGRWWTAGPPARIALGAITLPGVVWVAHATALGFWHVPGPYGWALKNEWVHAIEHASFLLTGCLFWWVVFQPTGRRQLGYGAAVVYVSALGAVMGAFAAVLTFARAPWYLEHLHRTAAWGLSPLEDQQLAGLIMWIPASLVYLAAVSFCFVQWLEIDGRVAADQPLDGPPPSKEPAYVVSSMGS
jgi:putative membrane protein